MKTIYEAKDAKVKKLSKDFELIGNPSTDWKTKQAKNFLNILDERVASLGLTYDQCRSAAIKFKKGDFEGALKTIWKNKLRIESKNSENGYTSTYTYIIPGYGEFIEDISRSGLGQYSHTITGNYESIPTPSYGLSKVVELWLKKSDEDNIERSNMDLFRSKNTAAIYNILFVGFDTKDLSSVLSKFHIRLKNKLNY